MLDVLVSKKVAFPFRAVAFATFAEAKLALTGKVRDTPVPVIAVVEPKIRRTYTSVNCPCCAYCAVNVPSPTVRLVNDGVYAW